MIGQLSDAVEVYRRAPIEEDYFISPQQLGIRSPSLFAQETKNGNFVLNPEYYNTISKKLQPLFVQHEKGLLVTSSAEEADRITRYLNEANPEKTFASLHPGLEKKQRDSVHALYEAGQINFIVAVKELEDRARYPGMSLYVDLNRDTSFQAFLHGVSHVLDHKQSKNKTDIISFMEPNPDKIHEYLATLSQALASNTDSKTRTELTHLRTAVLRATNPTLVRIDKVADASIDYMLRHGTTPNESIDNLLYQHFQKYRYDPFFISRIKENSIAWETLSNSAESPQEMTEREAIADILRRKAVSSRRTTLYNRILQYRTDPKFLAKLRENPEAWEIFKSSPVWQKERVKAGTGADVLEKAAQETIDYILQHKNTPTQGSAVYRRFLRYSKNPAFVARLKENPEVWEIFNNYSKSGLNKTLQAIIDYILQHKTVPKENSPIYNSFRRHRDDPRFISKLKDHPEAWEIFSQSNRAPHERVTQEMITYILQNKTTPPSGSKLNERFKKYRYHPAVIEKLKENPEVWEIIQKSFRRWKQNIKLENETQGIVASPEEKTARETVDYILQHKALPPSNLPLYQRFMRYRKSPIVIAKLQESPEVWNVVNQVSESPQAKAARETIDYILKHKTVPPKSLALYDRVRQYRNDPEFIAILKENPDAWEIFQIPVGRGKKKSEPNRRPISGFSK